MATQQMSTQQNQFLKYNASVETIRPNEQRVFEELAATARSISEKIGDQFRHTMRPLHAKSHGLLKAELTLHAPAEPYRQGLFAKLATYPAIIRLSTTPGDILPDSISAPRGWAMKLVGVEGFAMLPGHEEQVTQDFVFVNGPVFGAPNAEEFSKLLKLLEKHATDSTALKQVVSTTARTLENALGLVGGESGTLKSVGHPETHILGETFFSQAALRYGDYVAKICVVPASDNLKALTGKHLDHSKHSALRDAVLEFFKTETAEWEVKVQLATDLEKMPVEDASVRWPEDESPYVPVGRLVAKPQNAYSSERRIFVDELLSFNPWHGLLAHQPLGGVMRARKVAYPIASSYRRTQEQRPIVEPKSIGELPD
jgi:catalase